MFSLSVELNAPTIVQNQHMTGLYQILKT